MKNLLKFAALLFAAAILWACEDDKEQVAPGLEVTANNIAGTWQLAAWKGAPLAEGSYVYIEFVRKDRTFTMYQNIDSFGPRKVEGEFAIYEDPDLGAVIRGMYNYGVGDWNQRYIISDLTKTSMVWTVTTDPEDVTRYERCDGIPEEILNPTQAE